MGLLHKAEDSVPVFYGLALALWQPLAAFADMNFVALAGKLLIWPPAPADFCNSAPCELLPIQSEDHKPDRRKKNYFVSGQRCPRTILRSNRCVFNRAV